MGCGKSKETVQSTQMGSSSGLAIRNTIIKHKKSFKDEYQSGNRIGTGGFAEVRRCTHKLTGTMRAVKIYSKSQFPADYLAMGGLQHEIDILRMIDHPNVVKCYEYFEDEKSFYITMEFCMGGELFDKIGSLEKLTEAEVCDIMRQLFSVIAYLHELNIVHRDLKPENILIEDRNNELHLKIADFGNAVLLEKGSKLVGETGTCYYMAPEVISDEYNEKCDVWSCAVIMFMLLTGNPPFEGTNDEEIMANVKKQKYSLDSVEMQKVSEEAKDLIKQILVPESQRISALQALAHDWFNANPTRKMVRKQTITSVTQNLKNFKASFKLKDAVRTFIINHVLTIKDTKATREVFGLIDSDQDGKISENDLFEYLKQNGSENEAKNEASAIMKQVDNEGRGFIEYSQYLRAGIDSQVIMSRNNLIIAFNMLDTQKEGVINAEKLMGALDAQENDINLWKNVISEVSRKNDGTIDLQQFIELLSQRI